jgi:hypothetical protein
MGYRRMQRSVARLFYVGGFISHLSVLDTSGTFINSNPLETELFNLRCRMCLLLFPFPLFLFMVRQWAQYSRRRQHRSQARTYASSACSHNKTCSSLHARNISGVTRFGKVLSWQRTEVWEESREGTSPILILGGGFAVCQVLMIVLGAVDLHQGFGGL